MLTQNPEPLICQGTTGCPSALLSSRSENHQPNYIEVASAYWGRNLRGDVDSLNRRFLNCLQWIHAGSDVVRDIRIRTEPKNPQKIIADFWFYSFSDAFRHINDVVNNNGAVTPPWMHCMDSASTFEPIEAPTRLHSFPQTQIVLGSEFELRSNLIARRALA